MADYIVLAKVDQIVTKEVQLLVTAGSEEEAIEKSRTALMDYPRPVKDKTIKRMVTDKANFWIPRDIDIITVEEEKKIA